MLVVDWHAALLLLLHRRGWCSIAVRARRWRRLAIWPLLLRRIGRPHRHSGYSTDNIRELRWIAMSEPVFHPQLDMRACRHFSPLFQQRGLVIRTRGALAAKAAEGPKGDCNPEEGHAAEGEVAFHEAGEPNVGF